MAVSKDVGKVVARVVSMDFYMAATMGLVEVVMKDSDLELLKAAS